MVEDQQTGLTSGKPSQHYYTTRQPCTLFSTKLFVIAYPPLVFQVAKTTYMTIAYST